MQIMGQDEFDQAKDMKPILKEGAKPPKHSPEEIEEMLNQMESPVRFQKELAVKIKIALDHQMKLEIESKGILSDHTRRWVESYNKILDRIQSAIYGDKTINLHLHKVSHSDISTKIRESIFEIKAEEKKLKY